MDYTPVSPGQRFGIKASEWNDVRKSAKEVLGGRLDVRAANGSTTARPDAGRIRVRNMQEDGVLPVGSVVCLGPSSLSDPSLDGQLPVRIYFDTADPGSSSNYAILEQPLEEEGVGSAIISGMGYARITADDDTATTARVASDGYTLLPDGNLPLLWVEPDTSVVPEERWCIVQIGGIPAPKLDVIVMGGGNSLGTYGATEYFGLWASYSNAAIETVPTAVPTAIDAVYANGLSAGLLNSVLVWCAARTLVATVTTFDKMLTVPEGVSVISYRSIQVPIAASDPVEFATVYLTGLV